MRASDRHAAMWSRDRELGDGQAGEIGGWSDSGPRKPLTRIEKLVAACLKFGGRATCFARAGTAATALPSPQHLTRRREAWVVQIAYGSRMSVLSSGSSPSGDSVHPSG